MHAGGERGAPCARAVLNAHPPQPEHALREPGPGRLTQKAESFCNSYHNAHGSIMPTKLDFVGTGISEFRLGRLLGILVEEKRERNMA